MVWRGVMCVGGGGGGGVGVCGTANQNLHHAGPNCSKLHYLSTPHPPHTRPAVCSDFATVLRGLDAENEVNSMK